MSNFHDQVSCLSTAEKFELLDEVWESLEASQPSLTDEQSSELEYRMAQYDRNPENVLPWGHVKAGLLKKQ